MDSLGNEGKEAIQPGGGESGSGDKLKDSLER